MIPNLSYTGVLTPLNLDPNPLVDQDAVLSNFNQDNNNHQVQHLPVTVLKKSVADQFTSRGIEIEKVDVWRWNLDFEKDGIPHTDGNYEQGSGRKAGVNWTLVNYDSEVKFYDQSIGNTVFEQVPDGRTHTLWKFPAGTQPIVSWKSKYPSLINPQTPHLVSGTGFRYSITLKFVGNLPYDVVLDKLADLRLDQDFWPVNIDELTLTQMLEIVNRLDASMEVPVGKVVGYNLPRDPELLTLLSKFCKKPIKSLRVFRYETDASPSLHIDYDNKLKQFPAYALNFTLLGNEDCEIDFYKNMGGIKEFWDHGAGSYMMAEDPTLLFKNSTLRINSPHLLRINIPHQVKLYGSSRRVLSIRFIDTELDNPTDIIQPNCLTI